MIKFLLLISVAPAIQRSTIEGFETIRSKHFDFTNHNTLNSAHLTPGEMKMFASHALRFIKHKCHAIDSRKLFKIQKYIAKRLSLLNPTKAEDKEEMYPANVIESMKNCSHYLLTPEAKSLKHQGRLFHVVLLKAESEQDPSSAASKKLSESESEHEPIEDENDVESLEHSVSAPSTDAPSPLPTPPAEDHREGPVFVPIAQFHFTDWFSSMWRSIWTFFLSAVPSSNSNHSRSRRSANSDEQDPHAIWEESVRPRSTTTITEESKPKVETPAAKRDGRQAFATLFDQVCSIYCKCPNHATAEEFQVGVIQLLKFLFTDQKSVDTAATHLVDDELIKEMKACAA